MAPRAASSGSSAAGARGAGRQARKAPALKANEERLLLESQELDLFRMGAGTGACVCPECHHELVRVCCLGITVRACLGCKGVWLAYPVVRDFARENEWFRQIGPAIQAAMQFQPR